MFEVCLYLRCIAVSQLVATMTKENPVQPINQSYNQNNQLPQDVNSQAKEKNKCSVQTG